MTVMTAPTPLTAQQYRANAESAANIAVQQAAGLASTAEKAIAYATVANVWTYLYEVQSKVDGVIKGL